MLPEGLADLLSVGMATVRHAEAAEAEATGPGLYKQWRCKPAVVALGELGPIMWRRGDSTLRHTFQLVLPPLGKAQPRPETKSRRVVETSTSPAAAFFMIRAAMFTAMPPISSSRSSTSPV